MHATEMDDTIAPATMPVTISEDSPSADEDQGDFGLSDGEAALQHVLSEVFNPDRRKTVAGALERSGFNEIQDVLLMNQAERDMLTCLDAYYVVTPLPQAQKNMLLDIKLFNAYCEDHGRPIMDWMKVSKADFRGVALYMEEEKVTIPPCPKTQGANATMPRNVTSPTVVTPAPIIDFSSASLDVKADDCPLVKQTPPSPLPSICA